MAGLVLVDSAPDLAFVQQCNALGLDICSPRLTPAQWASVRRPDRAEFRGFPRTQTQVARAPALPDIPLVVLTGLRDARADGGEELATLWRDSHARLAAQSSRGTHTVLPDAGHDIPGEAPNAIVDAVTRVIEAGRDTERVSRSCRPAPPS